MRYECVVKRLESNQIALIAREIEESPPVQGGFVLLEVECSAVDVHYLERVLAAGQARQHWGSLGWCSLVGRVAQVGNEVNRIRVGDRVSAIGPVASRVVLPAQECLVVPDSIDADQAAYWALIVALVRSVRRLRIEIGESVLVLGGGLVGNLVVQLSLVAGVALVVGLGSKREVNDNNLKAHEPGLAPTWIAHQDALQRALPQGKVDILIDTLGDFGQLNHLLSLVQDEGRAMLLTANGAVPTDFDFYPNVHRRSLKLMSEGLRTALRHNPQGEARHTAEAEFVNYLCRNNRLHLADYTATCVRPTHSIEQILPTPERTSLILEWRSPNDDNVR